jgi:molybdopterin molybdotransferase
VGDFDFVKDVIYELDCQVLLKGVRVKPGQHIMIARRGDKFIIGLPGFAYSATVMALVYLLPLIQKLQNGSSTLTKLKATLKSPFHKRAKKAEFTACNISIEDGRYHVDFDSKRVGSSAILTNTLGSLALLYTAEDGHSHEIGDEVSVILL